jgi:hypothetical protein
VLTPATSDSIVTTPEDEGQDNSLTAEEETNLTDNASSLTNAKRAMSRVKHSPTTHKLVYYSMNLLHDIAPGTADELNVIVEIPAGSQNKYEIDKETGLIKLDRAYTAHSVSRSITDSFRRRSGMTAMQSMSPALELPYPSGHPRPVAHRRHHENDRRRRSGRQDHLRTGGRPPLGGRAGYRGPQQAHPERSKALLRDHQAIPGKPVEVTVHGFEDKQAGKASVRARRTMYAIKEISTTSENRPALPGGFPFPFALSEAGSILLYGTSSSAGSGH